jgi:hypothetical protein
LQRDAFGRPTPITFSASVSAVVQLNMANGALLNLIATSVRLIPSALPVRVRERRPSAIIDGQFQRGIGFGGAAGLTSSVLP